MAVSPRPAAARIYNIFQTEPREKCEKKPGRGGGTADGEPGRAPGVDFSAGSSGEEIINYKFASGSK